jgi:hypothetical protein
VGRVMARSSKWNVIDDTEWEQFWFEHDHLVRRHTSLNEDRIMAANAVVRSHGLARNLSFGRPLLRMSEAQFFALAKRFPGLLKGSSRERAAIWKKIARDGEFRNLWLKD